MAVAGILLTGGRSRRMGCDKALLGSPDTWAERTGRLLARVADLAIEVGPGWSGLPAAPEPEPGRGPLAALAAGSERLRSMGSSLPVLVVATDLPRITAGLLEWLAGHPSPGSVIPLDGAVAQTLCARYSPADLQTAARLVAEGRRAMRDLLEVIDAHLAGPTSWAPSAGDPLALADVDTPGDLDRSKA